MLRALGPVIASICLAGCSARTPELPRVSLKDEAPAKLTFTAIKPTATAHTVKIAVTGGEGLHVLYQFWDDFISEPVMVKMFCATV